MRLQFRFRLIPFIATVLLVAIGVSAARWQEGRAASKLALQQELQQRAQQTPIDLNHVRPGAALPEFQRVKVSGHFVRDWPVYLDNRQFNGRPGFYVLMPFAIAGSTEHVLVARGWLPRDPQVRERIAAYPTPEGEVTLEGLAHARLGHALELAKPEALHPGAIVQNAGWQDFAAATRLAFEPLVLEQRSDDGDGLVRDWPPPNTDVNMHRGYVFQWYALAVTALLFFIITGFRSGSKAKPQ